MTICLVRCPSPFLIDERAFPPLGLMAVGAGLKRQGHSVVVFDGDLQDLPLDYPYYGFGPTAPEYPSALDCAHQIKDSNPEAKIVLGGAHATLNYELCQGQGFDSMVVGDGEEAAEEAFFGDRRVVFAESKPLDEYPIPDRSLVDIKAYRFKLYDRPATTIMGSRGCPFHCGFCCKNHDRVRLNSAERLITEIDLLHYDYGYDALAFPEDIFILNKKRTEVVAEHLHKRGIIWRCLVRADLVVKYGMDFLKMMKRYGCVGVGIGVESGSDRILQIIQKGESSSVIMQAIKMLKSAGIYTKGFFILGLPGESEESLTETDAFLKEAGLDDIDCKIFQPYPGSPIYDYKERYDIHWESVPLEYTFYKGAPGEYYGNISTSNLSKERIVEMWEHIEGTYKDWESTLEGVMCQP